MPDPRLGAPAAEGERGRRLTGTTRVTADIERPVGTVHLFVVQRFCANDPRGSTAPVELERLDEGEIDIDNEWGQSRMALTQEG